MGMAQPVVGVGGVTEARVWNCSKEGVWGGGGGGGGGVKGGGRGGGGGGGGWGGGGWELWEGGGGGGGGRHVSAPFRGKLHYTKSGGRCVVLGVPPLGGEGVVSRGVGRLL